MKFLMVFLAFEIVHAQDSFTIIRDNKQYACEYTGDQGSGTSGSDCATKAYSGPFSREESISLCRGANSEAPAECGILAYSGPFSRTEAVQICTGAYSTDPAECASKAYSGPFSKEESVRLCARSGSIDNADCAIKAYSGPYSKEESITLCSTNPRIAVKGLNLLMQNSPTMKSNYLRNLNLKNQLLK